MRAHFIFALLCVPMLAAAQRSANECESIIGPSYPTRDADARMRAMMDCILAPGTAESGPPEPRKSTALPPSNDGALAFAKSNAGKYKSEVQSTAEGTRFTVRARLDLQIAKYDGNAEALNIGYFRSQQSRFEFIRACKTVGSFIGQNAFGVKIPVRRQRCDVAAVSSWDHTPVSLSGNVPMRPAQFRKAQDVGLDVEVDFQVSANSQGFIAEYWSGTDTAQIDHPVETSLHEWTLQGNILEVRAIVGGNASVIYRR